MHTACACMGGLHRRKESAMPRVCTGTVGRSPVLSPAQPSVLPRGGAGREECVAEVRAAACARCPSFVWAAGLFRLGTQAQADALQSTNAKRASEDKNKSMCFPPRVHGLHRCISVLTLQNTSKHRPHARASQHLIGPVCSCTCAQALFLTNAPLQRPLTVLAGSELQF